MTDLKYLCATCGGTGKDEVSTLRARMSSGYIQCRPCQGNGLDPAKFFRWGAHPKLSNELQQLEEGTLEADRNG